jgi:hypothetical protein
MMFTLGFDLAGDRFFWGGGGRENGKCRRVSDLKIPRHFLDTSYTDHEKNPGDLKKGINFVGLLCKTAGYEKIF